MKSGLKTALSLLLTFIAFTVIAIASLSGLFSPIEKRFYEPAQVQQFRSELNEVASAGNQYFSSLLAAFGSDDGGFLNDESVLTFLSVSPSDEVLHRLAVLSEAHRGLEGIRVVDASGRRVHFSSFRNDYRLDAGRRIYSNYQELKTLFGTPEIPFENLSCFSGEETHPYRIGIDGQNQRIVYSFPLENNGSRFCVLFYVGTRGFINTLIEKKIISVNQDIPLVSSADCMTGGFVLGLENDIRGAADAELLKIWKNGQVDTDGIQTDGIQFVFDDRTVNYTVFTDRGSSAPFFSILFSSDSVLLPGYVKILILVSAFISVCLFFLILFNFKKDDDVIIRDRIKRVQFELLSEYFDKNLERAEIAGIIEAKKSDVSVRIKKSLGRRGKKHSAELDTMLEKSWSEIIDMLSAEKKQQPSFDMSEIRRMLEELLSATPVTVRNQPVQTVPAKVLEDADSVEPLEDLEEADGVEPAEDLEEVDVVEPAEDLEDVDAVEPVEDLEESDVVEPADDLEEADVVEPAEDLEDAGGVEPVDDLEEADAVEPVDDLEEADGVEPADDLEGADGVEPAENLEGADGVEPVEDLEESDGVEPVEDLEEVDAIEPVEDLEEANGVEPVEDLEEADGVEPADDLEEVDAVEPVEDLKEADGVEPVEDLEEADVVEPAEDLEEADSVEPADDLEEADVVEPADDLEEAGGVEPVEDLEEAGGAEPADGLEEADGGEPVEDLEEVDAVEPVEDLEEVDSVEPVEDLEEAGGVEPAEDLEEADGVEPVEDLEDADGVEPAEDLEEAGGAEPVEDLEGADGVEPAEDLEEADSVEPVDGLEEVDGVEPADGLEEVDAVEPAEDLEEADGVEAAEDFEEADTVKSVEVSEDEIDEPSESFGTALFGKTDDLFEFASSPFFDADEKLNVIKSVLTNDNFEESQKTLENVNAMNTSQKYGIIDSEPLEFSDPAVEQESNPDMSLADGFEIFYPGDELFSASSLGNSENTAVPAPEESKVTAQEDDVSDLELLSEGETRPFMMTAFGANNNHVTDLSYEAIVEGDDGVYQIAENLDTDGVPIDNDFQNLVNSVLK